MTKRYSATFHTTINLTVDLPAGDEDEAADVAWTLAQDFLTTVAGDGRAVTADASLDGIGADEVRELTSQP